MNVRKTIIITGVLATACLTGCSTQSNSPPFHVYSSPLLAADIEHQRQPSRKFDPTRLGDHPLTEDVYVVNDDTKSGWGAPSTQAVEPADTGDASAPAREAAEARDATKTPVKTPALSTTRSGMGGHEPQATQSGSGQVRPSTDDETLKYTPVAAAEFVWSVYKVNGVDLPASARKDIPSLYKACKAKGKVYHTSKPVAGDIVFFHNTRDANSDGRNNDWYTHVGLVDRIHESGTAEVLGYRDGKVRRFHLNLRQPDSVEVAGETANSRLRSPSANDAPFTQYHAGQLFAGFCSLLGEESQFLMVDNWQPGMKLERP